MTNMDKAVIDVSEMYYTDFISLMEILFGGLVKYEGRRSFLATQSGTYETHYEVSIIPKIVTDTHTCVFDNRYTCGSSWGDIYRMVKEIYDFLLPALVPVREYRNRLVAAKQLIVSPDGEKYYHVHLLGRNEKPYVATHAVVQWLRRYGFVKQDKKPDEKSTEAVSDTFKNTVRELALKCGFKLKEQPNGELDLNPYVYDFSRELRDFVIKEAISKLTEKDN